MAIEPICTVQSYVRGIYLRPLSSQRSTSAAAAATFPSRVTIEKGI